ncbi:LOW QUALITY PROTEIN: PPR domain-containing protein/PPR_2 domain-containing protein, partial [Cephalotus follicularis]
LHSLILKTGFAHDSFFATKLNTFYAKYASLDHARKVFDETPHKTVYLWNSTLRGYCREKQYEDTLYLFNHMISKGIANEEEPDNFTLPIALKACVGLQAVGYGKMIHGFVIKNKKIVFDMFVGAALIELYSKCGQMGDALKVFKEFDRPDVVLWTSMVTGYEQNRSVRVAGNLFREMNKKDVISWSSMVACYAHNRAVVEALDLFNKMIVKGVEPNSITFVSALQACAVASNLEEGKKIHEHAAKQGFELEVSVSTALIDMYMKCLSPDEAVNVFKQMHTKDVVTWAALFSGYALNGMSYKAMGVFDMLNDTKADAIAMVKILTACAELGILQQAVCLHGYVLRSGFGNNMFVGASLIELYSKCGSLDNAFKVFEEMIEKDIVIWSAMIASYGSHGQGEEALKIFYRMMNSDVKPNSVTFLSLMSACSHAGLIVEGIEVFDMMVNQYGLDPSSEHYGMMVDLLGRMGELDKAMEIINRMPIPAGPDVWGALLGACRIHQNTKIGEVAAKNLFCLELNHAGYILLSNIYALDEKWGNVAKIRSKIKERGLKKMIGQSVVEVRREVHSFVADDRFHLECEQIYELLRHLDIKMRDEGNDLDAESLLHDV